MTDLQPFTVMMASAQVVETSVNTNNSPSQDYTTNPDDHSNHNIDPPGFKPFTVIHTEVSKKGGAEMACNFWKEGEWERVKGAPP